MRKAYLLMALLCITSVILAQTNSWKQFDDFHSIVGKTLHPVITGNVQPVKQNSGLLLGKAKAWQASSIPKTVDSAVFKTQVAALVKQCTELDEVVTYKQTDKVLITKANEVHETFHALLKACNLKD